jgi:hypothetical protein
LGGRLWAIGAGTGIDEPLRPGGKGGGSGGGNSSLLIGKEEDVRSASERFV